MKIVNGCMVLKKDSKELRTIAEAAAYLEMAHINVMCSLENFVKASEDDETKTKMMRSCERILDLNGVVNALVKDGMWPNDSLFSPPFSEDFRDELIGLNPEELYTMFLGRALKEGAPGSGSGDNKENKEKENAKVR